MALERGRGWCAIAYQESIDENWVRYLRDTHIPIAAILHDRDWWTEDDEKEDPEHKAGELKKPHYHINFYFDGKKSITQMRNLLYPIGVKMIKPMFSTRGATRYLLHLDDQDKAQYKESEVIAINGVKLDFSEQITQGEIDQIMVEMAQYIRENKVDEFADFWFYCCGNEPDWFRVLNNSKAYVIEKVIASIRWKKYPRVKEKTS